MIRSFPNYSAKMIRELYGNYEVMLVNMSLLSREVGVRKQSILCIVKVRDHKVNISVGPLLQP